jgi:hypothetical protein
MNTKAEQCLRYLVVLFRIPCVYRVSRHLNTAVRHFLLDMNV